MVLAKLCFLRYAYLPIGALECGGRARHGRKKGGREALSGSTGANGPTLQAAAVETRRCDKRQKGTIKAGTRLADKEEKCNGIKLYRPEKNRSMTPGGMLCWGWMGGGLDGNNTAGRPPGRRVDSAVG